MNRYRLLLTVDISTAPGSDYWGHETEMEVLPIGDTPQGPLPPEVERRLLSRLEAAVQRFRRRGLP